jgi:SAM-dependent methyltransferase
MLLRLSRSVRELYRVCFLARAGEIGLLEFLAGKDGDVGAITQALGVEPDRVQALEALLDLGVSIGELRAAKGRYGLKGYLATALAAKGEDSWRAMTSEVAGLHVPCLLAAPGREADAAKLSELTVALSSVIARSSRMLEPVLKVVTRALIPPRGRVDLLEVGCGSGVYVLAALQRNRVVSVTAVEREPDVAKGATEAIARAGFADRCTMVNADIRTLSFGPDFDLITLHNNIYYFPEGERLQLLVRLHSWLRPGGRLAVTTPCRGGGTFARFMMLWSTVTAGAGSLPDPAEFASLLRQAGFAGASAKRLIPGESYTLFLAKK